MPVIRWITMMMIMRASYMRDVTEKMIERIMSIVMRRISRMRDAVEMMLTDQCTCMQLKVNNMVVTIHVCILCV